jgi:hypothetical protein
MTDSAVPPSFTVPHEQTIVRPHEETFLMARHELRRCRQMVLDLKEHLSVPVSDASTWAAFFFGAFVSAGIALFTVTKEVSEPGLVLLVVLWAGIVAFFVCGSLCLWFGKGAKRLRGRAIDRICEDFTDIENRSFSESAPEASS